MAFTDINSEDRLIQATRPRPRPIVALGTRALVEAKPWQALATASIHPERRLRHPPHRARGQHPRHGAGFPVVVSGQPRSASRRRAVSAGAPSAGQLEDLQRHQSAKAHLRPGRRAARFIRPSGHEGRLPKGSRISTLGNGDSKRALQPRPGPSETISFGGNLGLGRYTVSTHDRREPVRCSYGIGGSQVLPTYHQSVCTLAGPTADVQLGNMAFV